MSARNQSIARSVCASARSVLFTVPKAQRPAIAAQIRKVEGLYTANATHADDWKAQAAAAFESDMKPVCNAIAGALHAGDLQALQGLRALLPHLLTEVNQSPALADLLAHQLGKSLLEGLKANPEEAL